ncbi:MAG: InlB B-repeat-containing protein [Paludibacteraceae bacterium]|nr:InlB B-repeat-containing protein [Paludibacteraceae bacterium]
MPDANVTVSATFNALPTYNIRFYNNGTQIGSTQSVYQGGIPDVPVIESCEGYTFVGWWTESLASTNTTAKSWIEDFTATANKDYYAVFEHTTGGGASSNESVTFSDRYTSDTEVEGTKITIGSHASVTFTKRSGGTNSKYYAYGNAIRWYGGGKCVVESDAGNITAITFTFGSSDGSNTISADVGTYSSGSWTGESSLVTFTQSGTSNNRRIAGIAVTIGGGGTTYYTSTTDCPSACTKLDAPSVTATPGNGQITLSWVDVADADHYTVTIGTGVGYTTECGSAASIGTITHSGTTNTCIITGLTNGLTYTTNVVANASSSTCDSDADSDSATPQDCTPWDDPALSWNKYSLNTTTTNKTATKSLSGETHGTLSFESSNTDVLTVDGSTGMVTAVGAGEATVIAHWTAADGYCEKTMTSSTFEVAGPLTISFDANGGTGTMTDQTVTYNVSAAIKDNAFSREGYSFIGWAISAEGEKVYNDKQSVAFTNSQTLYAKWQLNSHDVSFTPSPTGAAVTINGQSTSPQTAEYGTTVTLHITPAEHYTITSVSIQGATSLTEITQTGSGETRTFTMPDENVTVSVTMGAESTYTATFYNSGTQYGEAQTGYADEDITAPVTTPEACDESFSFVGWVAAEQTSETTTKPEVLTFPQTMPAGNVSFYALYRRVEGSGGGEASVIFKTASSDSGTDRTEDSAIKENLVESYTGISSFSASRAYLGKSGVKLGASGGAGYITLNLSSPITTNTITVNASRYGTDTGDLEVEVNGSNSFGSALSPADGTLTFTNASEVEITDLTISTTSKRAYVASISLGGGGTSYYTTSPVCVPCDYQVTLTKGAESHGTFTLNKADGTYDNCKTNFIVTVSGITPDDGYYCSGVTATGGSHAIVAGPDGSGNYTVSYTKGNTIATTITANFEPNPTYAVTWSMDGDESTKVYYEEGQEIAFPTSATGCEDKTFMGWTAAAIANPQAEAPTYVTSATMGTSPITYYAVYAEEDEGGSGEITKTTSIAVGDVVYLVYEEDKYELDGISTTSTKYGIGTSYTSTPNKLYPLEVVNGNAEGSVAFKNNDSYLNYSGSSNTLNKNATLSDNTSWTVTFSGGNAIIKNVNNTSRTIRWNSTSGQERFACYTNGMQPVQLYKSSTSYTNYTTTCGAGISAKNIGWITAAKGQKVKRVINVSAKGFDEATTLTASSGDAQFKVTLGASNVPAGKTGLSTTLTVEYTPTASDNRIENVEIVLTAGGITRTITVSGRSLPDEFLAITKKSDTWYALPANMNGGENQYAGVVVTPDNDSDPTMVAIAPSTIVYSLHSAANSRYAENGAYVRLAGNDSKALWGNTAADALTIQNSETIDLANAEDYEWSLSTTDGIHYTIANPHHADYASGRVLAYSDKYGLYKTSTVFFLVPAGCNSQPQEVNVSARRADATFSWVSNASSVTIDLYTDEGKTAFAKSATATSVPYYMTGLEESTHYWFTLTPEGETACAVSGDFETSGPTIDVVEWKEDTVVIFVDKDDEFHPSIVIDGEVEHGAGTGAVATDIFFSKYFEAAASVKLLAIFNGTNANVDLSDYSLSIATNGGTFSHTKFEDIVKKDNTYLTAGELLLESGEELILITYSDTDNDNAIIKCAKEDEENSGFSKYVRIKTPSLEFNGDDVIALKNPSNEFIDIIGASDGSSGDQTNITPCSGVGVSGCDFMDKPGGWYNAHGYQDKGTNAEESNYALATNRCLLIRRNHVTTGRTAVERNTTDFVTLGDYTYEAVNYQGEWKGVQIPGGTSSTTDAGIVNACTGFEHVGGFNYSDYYKGYETIETQALDSYTHDEATKTYEIPIPDLAKYSCLNIRFQLKNDAEEVVTEAPVQVPIIVKGGHTTIDAIFNKIVKKDDGDPLYDESKERCRTCDVVVLSDGVLTKATDGSLHDVPEVGDVKVYPGGKLIVPPGTSYSVNSLAFRRQEDEVATANIQGDLDIKATGNNVYLDLRIDPSNWHYISLPYNCNVSDIRFADDEVKIPVLGVDYLLKYYDGKKRAATQAGGCWEMVASDATLKKGIGYIFGIPGTGKVQREFRFPMSNAVVSEEKESTKLANGVYAYGGDKDMTEVRANHRGWNLIGDPYLLPYTSDIEEPVMTGYIVPDYSTDPWDGHYKFDPDPSTNLRYIVEPVDNGRSEYIQVAITNYNMKPFTSYFVQIGGSDPEAEQGVQFNLSKVDRSASPVRRAPAAYEEQEDTHPVWCAVNITSPKGETDETTMLISDQFTDGYDMMDDLVKMRGTYYQYAQITTKPVLASRNNEGEMAFNALPDASAEAGIPLHYFAATQGEYVLAYSDKYGRDEVKAVMLLDKQTNEWHDLMNAPYEFYTNRTDDKDRFVLTIRVERKNGPQITTDIDAASSADDRPRKILHKDHIYILRGDKIYDITGKEL